MARRVAWASVAVLAVVQGAGALGLLRGGPVAVLVVAQVALFGSLAALGATLSYWWWVAAIALPFPLAFVLHGEGGGAGDLAIAVGLGIVYSALFWGPLIAAGAAARGVVELVRRRRYGASASPAARTHLWRSRLGGAAGSAIVLVGAYWLASWLLADGLHLPAAATLAAFVVLAALGLSAIARDAGCRRVGARGRQ